MAQRWIDIGYKCQCMSQEVTIQIHERGKWEDIEDFLRRVRDGFTADHRKRSPLCTAEKTEYAKIPAVGEVIGAGTGGTA